jgi:hypothetical protein
MKNNDNIYLTQKEIQVSKILMRTGIILIMLVLLYIIIYGGFIKNRKYNLDLSNNLKEYGIEWDKSQESLNEFINRCPTKNELYKMFLSIKGLLDDAKAFNNTKRININEDERIMLYLDANPELGLIKNNTDILAYSGLFGH